MTPNPNRPATVALPLENQPPQRRPLSWRSLPARIFALLVRWSERHRERRRLRELDARSLQDLGLTRAEVAREAGKPFWLP